MSDPGTRATDAAQAALERQMRKVYRQAQEEIIEKLNEHLKKFKALDVKKRAQLAAGTLTKEDYEHWLNGQVFIGKQWQDKVTSVAATLMDANKQANDMIEGKKRAVFGENASFQAYKLEHDAGIDLSFSVYDSATVTKLLNEHPELLPRKVVNGVKDQAWNRRKIANAVMQGIIQGEAIDEIADRIALQTGSQNMNAMTRYARTAMTGAQNAGRMETMHEAQDMGIKVKKKWIATLDSRTRDAHADLDGQVQEVDKPFDSELGKIMYPGDITADPANVWNCRCTLGYVYDEYPERYAQRRAYVEYVDDNGEYHRESHEIANMSYNVWKLAKDRDNQRALKAWREGISYQEWKNYKKAESHFAFAKLTNYDVDGNMPVEVPHEIRSIIEGASQNAAEQFPLIENYVRDMCFGDIGEGNPAQFDVGYYGSTPGFIIALNKEMWKNVGDITEFVKQRARDGLSINSSDPRSIIMHEYGHAIHTSYIYKRVGYNGYGPIGFNARNALYDVAKEVNEDIEAIIKETKDAIPGTRKFYSTDEYVAEAFSDYYYGEKHDVSKKIVEYFKRRFK